MSAMRDSYYFIIDTWNFARFVDISSIILGSTYTMPHSPDLNLTMTREYGGIKTIETKGGASLSNAFYTKPPAWGNGLGAWELGNTFTLNSKEQALSRSGRRIWDLSFSYMDDRDMFGSNQMLSSIATPPNPEGYDSDDDLTSNGNFNSNILYHNNFYSQVIHKTNGGQLPFIFQPDGSNSNADSFAIAKLDMNSFKFEQVANGVYNVKLKIREVW